MNIQSSMMGGGGGGRALIYIFVPHAMYDRKNGEDGVGHKAVDGRRISYIHINACNVISVAHLCARSAGECGTVCVCVCSIPSFLGYILTQRAKDSGMGTSQNVLCHTTFYPSFLSTSP